MTPQSKVEVRTLKRVRTSLVHAFSKELPYEGIPGRRFFVRKAFAEGRRPSLKRPCAARWQAPVRIRRCAHRRTRRPASTLWAWGNVPLRCPHAADGSARC